MSLTLAIILVLAAIVLSGLFSGSEIAFVQSSKVRMEIDAARGGLVDRIIRGFSRSEEMFISTLLVGNNAVLVVYGIAFSALVNPLFENWFHHNEALVLICNTLLSTLIILVTGEFLPKSTFRINPNFMMRLLALPLFFIYLILYPISWFVSLISTGLMKLFRLETDKDDDKRLTIAELDDYIEQSLEQQKDKADVENEVKIFRRAIDFKDTPISKCMIPRNEIVAVPASGTKRAALLQVFERTGLSKVVVYNEDIDDISGYIHVSELFGQNDDWHRHIKPVIYTPETMLANTMMRRMMSEKRSMVIVVDEFGGTAGLCTLEDLVEEIFGEIEDEHDIKKTEGRQIADGIYECAGRMEISALNEEFGLDIKESEQYDTLAGFIIDRLQALPHKGDSLEADGMKFTILDMSATRIEQVRIERLHEVS